MSQNYDKLKTLLKELFQLDQPDLDFGLYRVMHAKSAEVSQFLDKDLLPQVQAAFGQYKAAEGKDRVFVFGRGDGGTGRRGELITVENDELVIHFEYRPATLNDWGTGGRGDREKKPPKQKDLIAIAVEQILASLTPSPALPVSPSWHGMLAEPHVTTSGEKADYTRLEAHLKRYTARNTFDYFIHKDLGGFLRRELDFYIKNEVMHLDDVENETASRVEQYLSKIKVTRKIAGKIIAFLAQLEDFQKKLWLKKKFVVETQYCITVGCIPEAFYPEIAANEAQREEWVKLGFFAGNAGVPPANERTSTSDLFDAANAVETTALPGPPKGWHSRGYLPHFDDEGLVQFVTFRLHDSVPAEQIEQWKRELHWVEGLAADAKEAVALRKRIGEYEDAGKGACYLRDERVAGMVENTLRHFDGKRYRLLEWCIMPNHVHVLVERLPRHGLSEIVHSWKSFTAHEANKLLGRTGDFWMPDYFDRFIRDEKHYMAVVGYIRENPVKAALVAVPEEWRWSGSAGVPPALFTVNAPGNAPVPGADNSGRDARVPRFREEYLLRYMLDVETRGSQSRLNVQAFTDPTAYKLKVKRPGSDESREVNVDLLETFNWLIGLTVRHIAAPQIFSAAFDRDSEKRLRLKGRLRQVDGEMKHGRPVTPSPALPVPTRVTAILDHARGNVVRSVNSEMLLAYWHIGREIVEALQGGSERAEYGSTLIETLAQRLTRHYGKGFSSTNLRYFRTFYQVYAERTSEIRHTPRGVLDDLTLAVEHADRIRGFSPRLGWSQYRALMNVENKAARLFYEIEAEKAAWSVSRDVRYVQMRGAPNKRMQPTRKQPRAADARSLASRKGRGAHDTEINPQTCQRRPRALMSRSSGSRMPLPRTF